MLNSINEGLLCPWQAVLVPQIENRWYRLTKSFSTSNVVESEGKKKRGKAIPVTGREGS
jgi:hypothetical protein